MNFTFLTQNQEGPWEPDRQMKTHPILFPFFDQNIIARLRPSLMIIDALSPPFAIELICFGHLWTFPSSMQASFMR
jgi:hypothetical protein